MGKTCLACGAALPAEAAPKRRYCNDNCRARAYRRRHRRERRAAGARKAPQAQLPLPIPAVSSPPPPKETQNPHAPPRPPSRRAQERRIRQHTSHSPQLEPAALHKALDTLRNELLQALATAERRLTERRREVIPPVPMDRQLLSQAPASAVGYRLVLPPATLAEKPRYAPRKLGPGTSPHWTLRPIQLPDDDRLRDGELYRILWLDAQGRRIAPSTKSGVPGLRFHLTTAPLSEDPALQQYEQALRLAADQPYAAEVRKRMAERSVRRAREMEAESARRHKVARDAAERQRNEEHLAETRKQVEALSELQRRAQALADAQVAVQQQPPSWHAWLPVALSLLPVLLQGGLSIWDHHQRKQNRLADQESEESHHKLHAVFSEGISRLGDALGKVAPLPQPQPPASGQTFPKPGNPPPTQLPPAAVSSVGTDSLTGQRVGRMEQKAPNPFDSEVTLQLGKKAARSKELEAELRQLLQAPASLQNLQRVQAIEREMMQLAAEVEALQTRAVGA